MLPLGGDPPLAPLVNSAATLATTLSISTMGPIAEMNGCMQDSRASEMQLGESPYMHIDISSGDRQPSKPQLISISCSRWTPFYM